MLPTRIYILFNYVIELAAVNERQNGHRQTDCFTLVHACGVKKVKSTVCIVQSRLQLLLQLVTKHRLI